MLDKTIFFIRVNSCYFVAYIPLQVYIQVDASSGSFIDRISTGVINTSDVPSILFNFLFLNPGSFY